MLHKYFDMIFCINLPKRVDRRVQSEAEFEKHGIINIEWFDAIDGDELNIISPTLLQGEIGALYSHIGCIKIAKRLGLESILIFEDDVIFDEDIEYLFPKVYKELPYDWDLFYLGSTDIYGQPVQKVSRFINKLNWSVALHAYAVKNTMFDKIIETSKPHYKQIDGIIADMQNYCNAYGCNPKLAFQRPSFSDIQNRFVDYKDFS